jgi:hypothetical protein
MGIFDVLTSEVKGLGLNQKVTLEDDIEFYPFAPLEALAGV